MLATLDLDALVTAREAVELPGLKALRVCRHRVYAWRSAGQLAERGRRGRSPLYRLGDVLLAERAARCSGYSHRSSQCRSCLRATERA